MAAKIGIDVPKPSPEMIGPMKGGSDTAKARNAWLVAAWRAGVLRADMAKALNIAETTIPGILRRELGYLWRLGVPNKNAIHALAARARARRDGVVNGVTYAQLHADGLTCREAAQRRGEGLGPARRWAEDHGVKWADRRSSPENAARHGARLASLSERRKAAVDRARSDPARYRLAMLTEKERAEYDALRKKGIFANEALTAIGRADVAQMPVRVVGPRRAASLAYAERRAARAADNADGSAAVRRKISRAAATGDAESIFLALMARDAATQKKQPSA